MVVKVDVERKQVDDAFDNCRVRAFDDDDDGI